MLKLIKFHFETPLHIMTASADYDESRRHLHADSLYAAIMQAWALLGRQEPLAKIGTREEKIGQLNFALSSLFPFTRAIDQDHSVYFLPRIFKAFHKRSMRRARNQNKIKLLKKLEWLDLDYFEEHVREKDGAKPDLNHLQGAYLSSYQIDNDFMSSRVHPRVVVPRVPEDATPFYTDRLYFQEGSGLYGLFQGPKEEWEQVLAALQLLQYEGLGTDRQVGNGQFRLEIVEESSKAYQQLAHLIGGESDHVTNLSLFSPDTHQQLLTMLDTEHVGYHLIKRGGWITTEPYMSLRKNSLFMMAEGSVFARPDRKASESVWGAVRNIRPDTDAFRPIPHPIWRSGRSLFVPVTI